MNKEFIIGSHALVKGCLTSMSIDYVEIIDNPSGFNYIKTVDGSSFKVYIKRRPANEIIDFIIDHNLYRVAGVFLVDEVREELGVTVNDMERLQPMFDTFTGKYEYLKKLFDAIINNTDIDTEELIDSYCDSRAEEESDR